LGHSSLPTSWLGGTVTSTEARPRSGARSPERNGPATSHASRVVVMKMRWRDTSATLSAGNVGLSIPISFGGLPHLASAYATNPVRRSMLRTKLHLCLSLRVGPLPVLARRRRQVQGCGQLQCLRQGFVKADPNEDCASCRATRPLRSLGLPLSPAPVTSSLAEPNSALAVPPDSHISTLVRPDCLSTAGPVS